MTKLLEAPPFPTETKRHVHFHDFFRSLQQQLGPETSMREAIDTTLTRLLTDTKFFFFDELHVHDPGSAALLNRLLAEITAQGIPTLITSNYEPESLLSDPTFHHVIERSIRTLRSNFQMECSMAEMTTENTVLLREAPGLHQDAGWSLGVGKTLTAC